MLTKRDKRKLCSITWKAKEDYLKQLPDTREKTVTHIRYQCLLRILKELEVYNDYVEYQKDNT